MLSKGLFKSTESGTVVIIFRCSGSLNLTFLGVGSALKDHARSCRFARGRGLGEIIIVKFSIPFEIQSWALG